MPNVSSDARPKKVTVPWNPWWAVLFIAVIFYGSQLFSGTIVSLYALARHWSDDRIADWLESSVTAQFAYILIAEAFVIGAIYLFLRLYKLGFASIGLRRPRWSDLVYGLAAVPFYILFYFLTVAVVSYFVPGLDIDQEQQLGFNNVHGGLQLTLTFISLVILPPLTEEIMVRGFLYGSLKKAMPIVGAVLATSAIFAVAHLPEGGAAGPLYIAALDTFVLSLVLIYLREKTDGLWASITLHAIKNGIAFTVLFVLHTG